MMRACRRLVLILLMLKIAKVPSIAANNPQEGIVPGRVFLIQLAQQITLSMESMQMLCHPELFFHP
jgi:hypothetical protein